MFEPNLAIKSKAVFKIIGILIVVSNSDCKKNRLITVKFERKNCWHRTRTRSGKIYRHRTRVAEPVKNFPIPVPVPTLNLGSGSGSETGSGRSRDFEKILTQKSTQFFSLWKFGCHYYSYNILTMLMTEIFNFRSYLRKNLENYPPGTGNPVPAAKSFRFRGFGSGTGTGRIFPVPVPVPVPSKMARSINIRKMYFEYCFRFYG